MLSSIYYGEIQSDKLESWNENKDPYNILVENNRVYKLGGWEFLDIANKLFDNEKQLTIRFIRRRALASGDKLVTKGTYAKMARGEMVRFIAENNIENPVEIQKFDRLGYSFRSDLSSDSEYVFERKIK